MNFWLLLTLIVGDTIILYIGFVALTAWEQTDATYQRLIKGQDRLRRRVDEQNTELRRLRMQLRRAQAKIEEMNP